jgi:uncharacterized membrane protein YeaQ/YmgE (transglycosylase-associated protein family)
MSILAWLLLGFAGGLLVGWLTGARGRALAAVTVVTVLGAMIGGFLASLLLGLDVAGLDLNSLVAAAVGATLLFAFLRAIPPTEVFE